MRPSMMDQCTATENPEPQVVFRPSKRRKQFRQRVGESDTQIDESISQTNTPTSTTESSGGKGKEREDDGISETEGLSVAEVLRLRNARKSKLKGVEFRPEAQRKDGASAEPAPVPKDDVTEALELGMSRRFAPQAGLVGELVNKHMEEYIESELARRHAADKAAEEAQSNDPTASSTATPMNPQSGKSQEERPTMHGRLQEVDLGDEVRARNAAMTEQARRRLAGETIEDESDGSRRHPKVGKDGKPWRGRKRRASDDIKRDQMVEALMRENRLDIYDPPPQIETAAQPGTDEAADERIAEEFRREFMDAMAERRNQRRKAPAPPARSGAKQEEILKGPKLGGSRNARAAMRDLLLSQQEKDKKRR